MPLPLRAAEAYQHINIKGVYKKEVFGPKEVQDYAKDELTIVIPAYNEADRISPTLRDIVYNIKNLHEVIVVFDGNDNTPEVARTFGEKVRVLEYPKKLGRGGAIIEGFRATNSSKVCFVDADNAIPWFEIVRLTNKVSEETPVVVGSRWSTGARILNREGLFKIFAGRVWHYIMLLFIGLETKDAHCGLKCFDGNYLKKILPSVRTTNRMFDVALLYNVKKTGRNVVEVGIEWSHNQDSRMPYIHIMPIMFLYLIGLKLAHSKLSGRFGNVFRKYAKIFNEFH